MISLIVILVCFFGCEGLEPSGRWRVLASTDSSAKESPSHTLKLAHSLVNSSAIPGNQEISKLIVSVRARAISSTNFISEQWVSILFGRRRVVIFLDQLSNCIPIHVNFFQGLGLLGIWATWALAVDSTSLEYFECCYTIGLVLNRVKLCYREGQPRF